MVESSRDRHVYKVVSVQACSLAPDRGAQQLRQCATPGTRQRPHNPAAVAESLDHCDYLCLDLACDL
jgi:hypothetical protein